MILVSGLNDKHMLGEKSNFKRTNQTDVISSPLKLYIETSSILSYSFFDKSAVMITKDEIAHGIGDNTGKLISPSLHSQILQYFTEFSIKDMKNLLYTPISSVSGVWYTLYLVSNPENNSQFQLTFTSNYHNKYFIFLDTGKSNPVALFGGKRHAAAIDSEGSVIFIHKSIFDDYISNLYLQFPFQGRRRQSVLHAVMISSLF